MVVVMVNDSAPVRSLLSASLSLAGSFGPVRRAKKRTVACRSVGRWHGGRGTLSRVPSTRSLAGWVCLGVDSVLYGDSWVGHLYSGVRSDRTDHRGHLRSTHTDYKVTS